MSKEKYIYVEFRINLMEDPGEHLVGQYLKEIEKCDFVEYNLQTKSRQGEIDVVGINSSKNIVYICEVATHLQGLQYVKNNQPDNFDRFMKKFEKDIGYANIFKKFCSCHSIELNKDNIKEVNKIVGD